MPISAFPTVAHGDIFEPGLWNTYIRDNGTLLDSRTGGDPGAANRMPVSTSATTAGWQAMADPTLVTTVKVNAATPLVSSFAALLVANRSGFFEVGPGAVDGPVAGQTWYCYHIVETNVPTQYGSQLAVNINDVQDVWIRIFIAGAPTAWHRMYHGGNLGLRASIVLPAIASNAPAGAQLTFNEEAASGGAWIAEPIATDFIISRLGAANLLRIGPTGIVSALAGLITGAITATSAAISGALSAASATISGLLSAASAVISGNATVGGTLGVTGAQTNSSTIQATRLITTVADGATPPITVQAAQANVTVPNLKAASAASADNAGLLDGLDSSAFASVTNAAKVTVTNYTGNGAASRNISVGITPVFYVVQKLTAQGMAFGMGHDGVLLETATPGAVLVGWGFPGGTSVTVTGGYNTSGVNYRIVTIGT